MSIVAISHTYASLGDEIGRQLAEALGYRFADREIILAAAARYGQEVRELEHLTEERPSFWERLTDTKERYLLFVEAVIFALAAEDDVVLSGRGAPFSLLGVAHTLRVRITAPRRLRAERLGLGLEPGLILVRDSDRERAARVRSLYHVDWDDPLIYDLVLNTERLDVPGCVRMLREAVQQERFRSTAGSRARLVDQSLVVRSRAGLLANPLTEALRLTVTCAGAIVSLGGKAAREDQRAAAEEIVAGIAGVRSVVNDITVLPPPTPGI